MFDNDILEAGSKTPYYVVIFAMLPIQIHLLTIIEGSILLNIFLFLGGMFTWGFVEYFLHRFVFHAEDTWMTYFKPNGLCYAFHFMIHGIHHAFP